MTDPLMTQAMTALSSGHSLFAGNTIAARIGTTPEHRHAEGSLPRAAAARSTSALNELRRLGDTDRELTRIVTTARADHAQARTATRAVLDDARADPSVAADTPMGRREAMARMAARLRAQHRHIAGSRRRARLLALRLRRLRYRQRRATMQGGQSSGRAAVVAAIGKLWTSRGFMTRRRVPAGSVAWIW